MRWARGERQVGAQGALRAGHTQTSAAQYQPYVASTTTNILFRPVRVAVKPGLRRLARDLVKARRNAATGRDVSDDDVPSSPGLGDRTCPDWGGGLVQSSWSRRRRPTLCTSRLS